VPRGKNLMGFEKIPVLLFVAASEGLPGDEDRGGCSRTEEKGVGIRSKLRKGCCWARWSGQTIVSGDGEWGERMSHSMTSLVRDPQLECVPEYME